MRKSKKEKKIHLRCQSSFVRPDCTTCAYIHLEINCVSLCPPSPFSGMDIYVTQ